MCPQSSKRYLRSRASRVRGLEGETEEMELGWPTGT